MHSLRTCYLRDKSSAHRNITEVKVLQLGLLCYLKAKSIWKAFFQFPYSPVTCSLPAKTCHRLRTESFLLCLSPELSSFDLSLRVLSFGCYSNDPPSHWFPPIWESFKARFLLELTNPNSISYLYLSLINAVYVPLSFCKNPCIISIEVEA